MRAFYLVFLDPPYGQGLGEKAIASALAGGWVAPGALVVWEEGVDPAPPPALTLLDRRRYGETMIAIFRSDAPLPALRPRTMSEARAPARPGLRLPRLPPRPGGDRHRGRGGPRRARHHADWRRQVALLPAPRAHPAGRHPGHLAPDRADARPGARPARRRRRRRRADLAVRPRRDRGGLRRARRRPPEAALHGARAPRRPGHRRRCSSASAPR